MKCHAQAINKIEVKVYGQKRIYKVMYQVSYPDEERLTSVRHGIVSFANILYNRAI